jgi:hypothetical protein
MSAKASKPAANHKACQFAKLSLQATYTAAAARVAAIAISAAGAFRRSFHVPE